MDSAYNERVRYSRILLLGVLLVTWPTSAFAYLDPGSSSLAYQVLVGGLLAATFALRRSWNRVLTFFSRRRERAQGTTPPDRLG